MSRNDLKRVFEIIPGLLTWTTIIGLFVLAFIKPLWVAIFVITFDLYWVIRISYLTSLLVFAYRILEREKKMDWLAAARKSRDRRRVFGGKYLSGRSVSLYIRRGRM